MGTGNGPGRDPAQEIVAAVRDLPAFLARADPAALLAAADEIWPPRRPGQRSRRDTILTLARPGHEVRVNLDRDDRPVAASVVVPRPSAAVRNALAEVVTGAREVHAHTDELVAVLTDVTVDVVFDDGADTVHQVVAATPGAFVPGEAATVAEVVGRLRTTSRER